MKKLFIYKFIFNTNNGKFRYSFIFPVLGLLIGAYSIFMTFSIMNGMQKNISKKINILNYNYSSEFIDTSKCSYDNYGYSKMVMLTNDEYISEDMLVELYIYEDKDNILNNLSQYLTINNHENIKGIIIGDQLAEKLNVSLNDTVKIISPLDLKVTTGYVPEYYTTINDIFSLDLLDYDHKYALTFDSNINMFLNNDIQGKYFSSKQCIDNTYNENNNLIVSAISIEKKVYTGLGFFLVLISCIMMFNIMTMVYIDKEEQLNYLNIIGLNKKVISQIIIMKNLILSSVFTSLGYLLSEITIYLNYEYELFSLLFSKLPMKITPMNIDFISLLVIFLFINILVVMFASLPFYLRGKIS